MSPLPERQHRLLVTAELTALPAPHQTQRCYYSFKPRRQRCDPALLAAAKPALAVLHPGGGAALQNFGARDLERHHCRHSIPKYPHN